MADLSFNIKCRQNVAGS